MAVPPWIVISLGHELGGCLALHVIREHPAMNIFFIQRKIWFLYNGIGGRASRLNFKLLNLLLVNTNTSQVAKPHNYQLCGGKQNLVKVTFPITRAQLPHVATLGELF